MKPLPVQFVTILAAFGFPSLLGTNTREFKVHSGERGWAGAFAKPHQMLVMAESRFEFDSLGDTLGNDGQPLFLSDQRRYIRCDEPFRFEFDRGAIRLLADSGTPPPGTHRRNLI